MGMTAKNMPYKEGFGPFAPEVYRFPFPNVYRRPEGLTAEAWVEWHVANLEHAFTAIVDPSHVAAVAPAILRHRIIPNFAAQSEGVTADDITRKILETVPKDEKLG